MCLFLGIKDNPIFKAMEDREKKITILAYRRILSDLRTIEKGNISLQDLKTILEQREIIELLMEASSYKIKLDMYANRLKCLEEHISAVQIFFENMSNNIVGT